MTGESALTAVSSAAYIVGVTAWRERHDEAVKRQQAARHAHQEASLERAQALLDGQEELGSQAAVARALGITRASVNQAIRALEKNKRNN